MKRFLLSFVALLGVVQVWAYTCKVDGICYNLNSDNQTATVTYSGWPYNNEYTGHYHSSDKLAGELEIPSTISYNDVEYTVTTIGENAFYDAESTIQISSVTIPSSVSSIGSNAFSKCKELTSVISENKNPFELGSGAFSGISTNCVLTVPYGTKEAYIAAGWTEEVFKGGVVEMEPPAGIIAFADAKMKELCIANWDTDKDGELSKEEATAVASLGEVFRNNEDITSFDELQYFTGLTDINFRAFCDCKNLVSIKFPVNVTTIGGEAFLRCESLTSVSLPEGLTDIEWSAFNQCTQLEPITLPSTLQSIGNYAFYNCYRLTGDLTLPASLQSLGEGAFSQCGMTSVELPDVAVLSAKGNHTFYHCSKLKTVTFKQYTDSRKPEDFHYLTHFYGTPSDCQFIIPEGSAQVFLEAGYINISDRSALNWVRAEFEEEVARIENMAKDEGEQATESARTALLSAIADARITVNAAEDYATIFSQIAAVKKAASHFLAGATLSAGVDVSAVIRNATFERFSVGWDIPQQSSRLKGFSDATYSNGDVSIDKFMQVRNTETDTRFWNYGKMYQTIADLPVGVYRLEADAIASWQSDESVKVTGVKLFAGNSTTDLATANGKPEHFSVTFENPVTQNVAIGVQFTPSATANWIAVDNFRLYYEGAVAAAPSGTTLVSSEDATYYIYNVEAGMYLNGGNGWGTQAVLAETGLPVRMTQDENGYWQIYFREGSRYQKSLYKTAGNNIFTDYNGSGSYQWLIAESDGAYTLQAVDDKDTEYVLGNDPTRQDVDLRQNTTLDTHIDVIRTNDATHNTHWQFIAKADYDLSIAKHQLLSTIFRMEKSDSDNKTLLSSTKAVYADENATFDEVVTATTLLNSQMGMPQAGKPIDMTALITNPCFENNTADGWTGAKLTDTGNVQNTQHGTHEFFNTEFNMSQTITGVPNGRYRLKYKGFHRPGAWEAVSADYLAGTDNASAIVYANEEHKTLKHIYADASDTRLDIDTYNEIEYSGKFIPNTQYITRKHFDAGLYADSIEVVVTDNILTIGLRNTEEMAANHWVIISDFELCILENEEQLGNKLTANDITAIAGGTSTLPIGLQNSDGIASFQFDVQLPEGITPVTDGGAIVVNATSRVPMTVLGNQLADGTCRFVAMPNGNIINAGEGTILSFKVKAADGMALGNYDIRISNIRLVNEELLRIQPFDITAQLTIKEAGSGDVNGDGEVDILDATYIVYHILGRAPAGFNVAAADVNGDNEVDILDATWIVFSLLERGTNAPLRNSVDPQ